MAMACLLNATKHVQANICLPFSCRCFFLLLNSTQQATEILLFGSTTMSEFADGPGNAIQETLEYLTKIDQVLSGRLMVIDEDEEMQDEGPRSRTSSTGSGFEEPKVYHGSAVAELREFFSKMDWVINGRLLTGDSPFDDDEDDDEDSDDESLNMRSLESSENLSLSAGYDIPPPPSGASRATGGSRWATKPATSR